MTTNFNNWKLKEGLDYEEELLNFYLGVCNGNRHTALNNFSTFLMEQGEIRSKIKDDDFKDFSGTLIAFGIWLTKNNKVMIHNLKIKEENSKSYIG